MGCASGKQNAAMPVADSGDQGQRAPVGQTLLGKEMGPAMEKKPATAEQAAAPAAAVEPAAALALEAAGGPVADAAAHAEMAKAAEAGVVHGDVVGLQCLATKAHPFVEDIEASPASATVVQRCRRRKATPWVTPSQVEHAHEPAAAWAQNWLLGTCCCNTCGEGSDTEIEDSP